MASPEASLLASTRMKKYVERALAKPIPVATPKRSLHVLDISGLGLSSLAGLPAVILDTAHLVDARHNDKLFHFYGLSTMKQLLVLDVRHCNITTFAGASLQPQLAHVLLEGSPLSMHPQVRIMAVLAFGTSVQSVDGVAVLPVERRAAEAMGGSGSSAAMCVALGLTSLEVPSNGEDADEYFRQLALVLKDRFLHDAREYVDKLHTLDAVMRRLHPTPSRGTPWMFPPTRWREVSEDEVANLTSSSPPLPSGLSSSMLTPPLHHNEQHQPSREVSRQQPVAVHVHHEEMERWKAIQWSRVVEATTTAGGLRGRGGHQQHADNGVGSLSVASHVSTPTTSQSTFAVNKLTRQVAAKASSMPRSTVAPLMRRSNIVSASPTSYNLQPRAEALSAKLERISVRAVTHTLPEEDEETAPSSSSPNRRNCWMTSSFDDISLIMRGDRNHPWSGVEELVVEDAALTIVSATSFKDREVRFSKPIRNLHGGPVRGDILATLLSKGTLLDHSTPIFTITRDEVDDVQFFNGDIADGDIDKTFPKVAHVRICLKRYPPPMESVKREGACMRETISIVPMVLSTSPASFVNAKQRAEEMFGALLAWCCSDVELSLLSPLRASPK